MRRIATSLELVTEMQWEGVTELYSIGGRSLVVTCLLCIPIWPSQRHDSNETGPFVMTWAWSIDMHDLDVRANREPYECAHLETRYAHVSCISPEAE